MVKSRFKINGKQYEVGNKIGPDLTLNEFIRNVAHLRGTTAMCHEGGCGACIVAVKAAVQPNSDRKKIFAVNSCLVSALSCHEWEIITVEGVGNKKKGYHAIQTRLANFNGTQCGYCTPGWVMSMYSLFNSRRKRLTAKEVENSFGSNMCRCTGYRPIADAFKSFAKDADKKLLETLADLEDLAIIKPCRLQCSHKCTHRDKCLQNDINDDIDDGESSKTDEDSDGFIHINEQKMSMVQADNHKWYRAYNMAEVFQAMRQGEYKLVAGNTGQGVFHEDAEYPPVMIDICRVKEINGYSMDVNLILGAGMSLTDTMELFQNMSKDKAEFSYLKQFYDHMDLVAHIPVRNIGTLGGNLMVKHIDNYFPSDVFLLFETVGAMMTVAEGANKEMKMTMPEFLKTDMKGKVIMNIMLPPLSQQSHSIKTYKIMPRAQNAHAIVNCGVLFKFLPDSNLLEKATLVYGGISPSFIHATRTEKLLVGKDPYTDKTLQLALKRLDGEVKAEESPPEPSAAYRKMLAMALYYKAILSLCPDDRMNPIYKSGAEAIKRETSRGTQTFETDMSVWPVNKPIPKIEALVQCSGEADFADDMPAQVDEVFAAFVTADTVPGSVIRNFDTSKAMKMQGVMAFYTAEDIPGENVFTPTNVPLMTAKEEILCKVKVKFFGQPAAIIVANRQKTANKAAKLVKIVYASVSTNKPLLTIDQVLKSSEKSKRVKTDETVEPTEKGNDTKSVLQGELYLEEQYHYHMETHTCVTMPTEDGMEVHSSTQFLDLTNIAIALCLDVPVNSIKVVVRRVGGGYGAKISRSVQIACASALVTHLLGKTCRMVLPMKVNMKSIGKRFALKSNFEIEVNDMGEIQSLKNTFYEDTGCSHNELQTPRTAMESHNCYESKRWYTQANSVLTDKYSNTWARAPFTLEGVAMIEYMMEKIAFTVKNDPIEVRLQNMLKENNPIPEMITQLRDYANFDERRSQVEEFNRTNRWRKRGIKLVPLLFTIMLNGNFNGMVSIYHGDGTVCIMHGGVELGQGINTKAAQVCGYILGIPLEIISVKPSDSFTAPNSIVTGGSIGSECVVFAVMKACEILNDRLQPIREKMGKNVSWAKLVEQAYQDGVDLQARYMYSDTTDNLKPYEVYAVAILESEVDILTGNHDILRVDLLEDTGRSLSPEVDIGQIEGAFVMGLGYWSSEKLVYDDQSGQLLTDRTWNYKIPGMKDIPADMRIYFRRGSRNPNGVLQSKATGEPAICLAIVFMHATREAVRSARIDAGLPDDWVEIKHPCTTENIFMAVGHKLKDYKLM